MSLQLINEPSEVHVTGELLNASISAPYICFVRFQCVTVPNPSDTMAGKEGSPIRTTNLTR